MKRSELEHLIKAAGTITQDNELIVIGSQSILAQFPDAPESLTVSIEADIFPKNLPELADLIDGSIGEESPFHHSFGYYAHGISEDTAVLPSGWKERLIPIKSEYTQGITGWCLEIHDLALSKYVAGREKDLRFNKELSKAKYVQKNILLKRLQAMELTTAQQTLISNRINQDFL